MNKKKMIIALFLSFLMLGTAFAIVQNSPGLAVNSNSSANILKAQPDNLHLRVHALAQSASGSTGTPWVYPVDNATTEPHYTGGTFKIGQIGNAGSMNPFDETTYCDAFVDCQIWGATALFETLPNGTNVPWMASGYNVTQQNGSAYNIVTNSYQNYSYVYTINIRPYVRWTDWNKADNNDTYVFSNYTEFCYNGAPVNHTFKSYKPTVMRTYYLQSADVVLNYRIKSYFGDFPNVVSVVPDGNLSVKFFVTQKTLLFFTDVLACDVLPYHIWVHHDYTTSGVGDFNWTNTSNPASPFKNTVTPGDGYCGWNLSWNPVTGSVPGMVGAGAFMVTNGFGMPQGQIIPGQHETLYVNPYYFTQYTPASSGLRQFTPKIYEIYMPIYDSVSSEVAAFQKGQIDTMTLAPPPNFLPQLQSTPNSFIYKKLSSAYGYWELNTAIAPLNITAFRQALSYSVPYNYINQVILDGLGYPSSSPINPGNTLYFNASSPNYDFDMAKAESLIKSIPGMTYSNGNLLYEGKQVTLTVQITTGAENPTGVAAVEKTFEYWNQLGIKTVLKQEAFTTLQSNVDNTILSHHKNNLFEIASEGESTALSDPILDCQAHLSPVVGVPDKSYLGPFTPMYVNGKLLNGSQVQQLFCKLINESISTDSFSVASQVAKELQTLIVEQDPVISTGYATDLIPLSEQFSNYSTTYSAATYLYWFWEYTTIYKNTSVSQVVDKYHLNVTETLNYGNTFNGDRYGNITFTVMNGTSPAAGVTLYIGSSSTYGGVVNITPNEITTNANGQAVWEFKVVSYIGSLLTGTNQTTGETFYVHNETVQIVVAASQPHATETATTSGNVTIDVVNGTILQAQYKVQNLNYNSTSVNGLNYVKSGQLVFDVTYGGSAYVGATVMLEKSSFDGITVSTTSEKTNSSGMAVFNFTVDSNLSAYTLIGSLKNTTLTAMIYSNNNSINNYTLQPMFSLARPAVTPPTTPTTPSNNDVYYIVAAVVAVVVVAGAAIYTVNLKKKNKKA